VTVILLADNQLSREGLRALMELSKNGCEIKGEASDGREALQKLEKLKPDILLTDIDIPGIDGIELARQARTVSPDTKSIIYSTRSDDQYVISALRAGAKGYVLKTASFEQLNNALQKVLSGHYYLSDELAERVIEYYYQSSHADGGYETLTNREKEVLLLARDGLKSREIARRLDISHRTAQVHRFRAMKKLHLSNQTELVRYFMEKGPGHVREKS
jgi:two-component system, NarL family, response regulator NreC